MPRDKQKLVNDLVNYKCGTAEDLQQLKYGELVLMRKKAQSSTDVKGTVVKLDKLAHPKEESKPVESESTKTPQTPPVPQFDPLNPPKPGDPTWSAYVMSKFADDELEGANPRLEGLRRVSMLLLGPILAEHTIIVNPPCADNGMVACATAEITIYNNLIKERTQFSGSADAHQNNCMDEFGNYLTAMAETRAKGRAYRSALCLNKVISAEEASFVPDDNRLESSDIKSGQISIIRIMADRLDISLENMFKFLGFDKTKLEDLTNAEALIVVKHMNTFQQNNNVPASLKKAL